MPRKRKKKVDTILQEPQAQTQEPEAQTQEPEAQTQEPEVQTQEPEVQTQEPKVQTQEPKAQTQEPKAQTQVKKSKSEFVKRIKAATAEFNTKYFSDKKKNGCDYTYYGKWQEDYSSLLSSALGGFKNKNILDVGGAYGSISKAFKKNGASKVTCVDISKSAVESKKFEGVDYVHAPVQWMVGVENGLYDIVHVSQLFHLLSPLDLERSIKEISRTMKNGAVFIAIQNTLVPDIEAYCEKHIGGKLELDLENFDKNGRFVKKYKWRVYTFIKE